MCTGLELIPLLAAGAGSALSVGGTIMQQSSARKDAERRAAARNRVLRENLEKQDEYAQEARGYFDERMDRITPQNDATDLATEQDAETTRLQGNITEAEPTDIAYSGAAPKVVESEFANKFRKAFQTSQDRARNAAQLGGYNAHWLNRGLADVAAGRRIDTVNNFSRATAALLPSWQDLEEQRVAKGPSGIGGILKGIGSGIGSIAGGWG